MKCKSIFEAAYHLSVSRFVRKVNIFQQSLVHEVLVLDSSGVQLDSSADFIAVFVEPRDQFDKNIPYTLGPISIILTKEMTAHLKICQHDAQLKNLIVRIFFLPMSKRKSKAYLICATVPALNNPSIVRNISIIT